MNSTNDTAFVNAMRLSVRHWLATIGIVLLAVLAIPRLWKHLEKFETGPDYRIPYSLSKDYWLYQRRMERLSVTNIVLIGDSVVWGEYVLPDGTLAHFLNQQAGQAEQFVNAGVNGLFPLALEGLIRYYGQTIHHQKVILHCNLLWMSSPSVDLQTEKEERFNHAALVPQFSPRIPCYKASNEDRLNAIVERNFGFAQWANHLQNAYFDQKGIPQWTLDEGGGNWPNAYKCPLSQITMSVPTAPQTDPDRGPQSPRHKSWGDKPGTQFDWVSLDRSLQWAAFQRLVELLRSRDNDVLVVVGPFNEHFMTVENQAIFRRLRDGVKAWLESNNVKHVVPETLPSALYADASHPLTEGYHILAQRLAENDGFRAWLNGR